MARYTIHTGAREDRDEPVEVEAGNWMVALGLGLDALGLDAAVERLACEVLRNGTVIARDPRAGRSFIVQPAEAGPAPASWDEAEALAMAEEPAEDDEPDAFTDEATDLMRVSRPVAVDPASVIARSASVEQAFAAALSLAVQLVPCEAASAVRLEADGGLRFVAATGPKAAALRGMRLPRDTGVVGFCAGRGVSLILHRADRDRRFFPAVDAATGFRTRSILCAPIRQGGRVHGCLELINPPPGGRFGRVDLDLLERVTEALAGRLEATAR